MGVGAGLYMYVVVVQKFTFAISSPDEFLLLDGDPAPSPLNFRPMFIIVIVISLEHCIIVTGLLKFKFYF